MRVAIEAKKKGKRGNASHECHLAGFIMHEVTAHTKDACWYDLIENFYMCQAFSETNGYMLLLGIHSHIRGWQLNLLHMYNLAPL